MNLTDKLIQFNEYTIRYQANPSYDNRAYLQDIIESIKELVTPKQLHIIREHYEHLMVQYPIRTQPEMHRHD